MKEAKGSSRDNYWKQQAILQWENDPCGLDDSITAEVGTRKFFEAIDYNRYSIYAPWLKDAVGFERFAGKKVLEVGFGMGTDLFQFASCGAEVFGIDLVDKHLEIATKRFEIFGIPAELQLADAENLPFEDNTFDTVYTLGVIHHTPDTQKAIDQIYRVLKPGGEVIVGVYHKNSAFYMFDIVLTQYILMRRFLRESFTDTVSRIERRESSDAKPLVKAYSRRRLAYMLNAFESVNIDCYHLNRTDFGILQSIVSEDLARRYASRLGWYLIARCTKS